MTANKYFIIEMLESTFPELLKKTLRKIEHNVIPVITEGGGYDPIQHRRLTSEFRISISENPEMQKPLEVVRAELLEVVEKEHPDIIIINLDPTTFTEADFIRSMIVTTPTCTLPLNENSIRVGAITTRI